MKNIKNYLKVNDTTIKVLVFIVPFGILIVNFIFYPYIPEDMPMQFASNGKVVYTLPKLLGIFTMPLSLLIIVLYMKVKKRITWWNLSTLVVVFLMNIYVVISIIG